jgi:sugar phosphate isomerase/epimerase
MLENEIKRCGNNQHLFAFHVCDWKSPTVDLLNDRGLMGEGCIPLRKIRSWVEAAGFSGFIEVEIFSDIYWKQDQNEFLKKIVAAYLNNV